MFIKITRPLVARFVLILILTAGMLGVKPVKPVLASTAWYVATTGSDSNDCATALTPCATINSAINKATSGDEIKVAVGTYTGIGNEVVLINESVVLSGGWNASFTVQNGESTIDGQGVRLGVRIISGTLSSEIEHFVVQNGYACDTGGIWVGGDEATLILNNSIVSNNTAICGGGAGGIYNFGNTTINNSTINNNIFGGVRNDGGMLTLTTSTVSNSYYGAGIRNNSGTIILNNSTISGNLNNTEGGGVSNGSIAILNNSTVSGNEAGSGGGGVFNTGTLTLRNSLVAKNTASGNAPDCSNAGVINSFGYNLLGNNSGCSFTSTTSDQVGTNSSPINPYLLPLQDNGGPAFTHALMADSPAIDAGDDANCPEFDQRGVTRAQNGQCDIGAYEYVHDLPVFTWNTFQGGDNFEGAADMVMDDAGNIYVVGNSDSPMWEQSPINPLAGGSDAFVAKFNQNGTLLWYTFMGSSIVDFNYDNGTGITLDPNGNIYVLGTSPSTWGNNPVRAFIGEDDIFVAKLNASGQLQWHTFIGGVESDFGSGFDLDQNGNIYITGRSSSDWGNTAPAPLNPFTGVPHNDTNPFVAKLSSTGQIQWYTFLANETQGMDIAVNANGIYAMGYSFSSWGSPIRAYTGAADTYVAKLNPNGAVEWNTFLGGAGTDDDTGSDVGFRIALNSLGDIFVTGESGMPWGNTVELGGGGLDGFVAKLDSNGALQWTTFVGGAGFDRVSGIAMNESDGSLLIAGESETGWGSALLTPYNQNGNTFLAKLDSTGALHWNALFGTIPYYSMGGSHSVAVWHNNVFVAGSNYGTWGTPIHAYSDLSDVYLLKAQLPAVPEVASIVRAGTSPTSASSVNFTVTFSEAVTDVTLDDFDLATTGVTNASPSSVTDTGDQTSYTVTVNTGSGDGTLRLDVVDDDSIKDVGNNPLGGMGSGNGNFTGGETYTISKIVTKFPAADFNGDGKTDVAVFRPTNGTWYISGQGSVAFGAAGDIPVPADYNGDGMDDIAVFRPSNSTWYIYGVGPFVYGTTGDIPVVADYNGDGKADIAVFRPSNSTWYIYGVGPFVYGTVGDIPVVADYNGDGKADIAVFRPSNSTWYIYGVGPFVYGTVGDIPVVADYNGDGKADIAVFRPSNSTWYIYGVGPFVYGTVDDIPVVGDYNGDGKADIAVFRPSNSTWYKYGVGPSVYGTVGDIPV